MMGQSAGRETKRDMKRDMKRDTSEQERKQKGENKVRQAFTYEAAGQTLVIHLPREIDHHNCTILKNETDLLLAENYITRLVFDFTRTEFMDSSGIGVLLGRYKQMKGSAGTVAYYGAGRQVKRILAIGGIAGIVKGYDTKEAAMEGRPERREPCRK